MRSRFDQFAKQMARQGLAPAGAVETDAEVSPDARRIDVWFTPDPHLLPEALAHLGMLGRLALAACTLEPFHQTPDGAEVMGCVCKHHLFREALARRAPHPRRRRSRSSPPVAPRPPSPGSASSPRRPGAQGFTRGPR